MSGLAWVPLYTHDFLADVGHLGNTELGIYMRLLLVYYRDSRPLPFDVDRLRRLAMTFSPEECRALDSVVSEFFRLTAEPDGRQVWRHSRADRVIAEATAKHATQSAKALAAASARWAKNATSNATSNACAMPTTTTTTTTNTSTSLRSVDDADAAALAKPRATRASKPKASLGVPDLVAVGVDAQVAADWLRARKAPLTATALAAIKREAEVAGVSVAVAVEFAAVKGWRGFEATWYLRDKAPPTAPPSQQRQLTPYQQRLQAGADCVQEARAAEQRLIENPDILATYQAQVDANRKAARRL